MKKLFTILFSLSFLISSYAQVSWCDDFEGYNDGDPIAQTSNIWTTWGASSSPGLNPPYGDDANIVTTSANSGTISLYFFSAPALTRSPDTPRILFWSSFWSWHVVCIFYPRFSRIFPCKF